jgi:heme/copper-type cytochrome/quinol oxidase subunit 3
MSGSTVAEHGGAHAHHHHREPLRFDQWPADPHYGKASLGKIGMWWFLLSDVLMFGGLLLAYGILRGGANVWKTAGQPEYGINFTAGLTFLLICSSITMVFAYAAAVENNRKKLVLFLGLTALGGILFLCGQYHEYFGIWHPGLTKRGLVFGSNAYANCFFVVTSFHGFHVFSGVCILLVTTFLASRGKYDNGNFDHVEIVGLFWHFVDLIWILVFTLIYLIPTT